MRPYQAWSPNETVDHQLEAYNARDIEAYCELFASSAVITRVNDGAEVARGIDAIRAHYAARFENPSLHCEVASRLQMGRFVIDHEKVIGVVDGTIEVVAIYEVNGGRIQSVRLLWP